MTKEKSHKIILRKTATLSREIKSKGVFHVTRITVDKAFISILARIYKFPASWHPPTSSRPYRITVAELVNSIKPKVVCEVGCGLGGILCRIKAEERHGYDIDKGVIRAAKLLHGRQIHFHHGSLTSVAMNHIDVLVLVNWIHEVSPLDLEKQLIPLLPRSRYLVLDAIDPDNLFGYRYKHDFAFLESKAKRLSVKRHPGEGRSFQLYEVVA